MGTSARACRAASASASALATRCSSIHPCSCWTVCCCLGVAPSRVLATILDQEYVSPGMLLLCIALCHLEHENCSRACHLGWLMLVGMCRADERPGLHHSHACAGDPARPCDGRAGGAHNHSPGMPALGCSMSAGRLQLTSYWPVSACFYQARRFCSRLQHVSWKGAADVMLATTSMSLRQCSGSDITALTALTYNYEQPFTGACKFPKCEATFVACSDLMGWAAARSRARACSSSWTSCCCSVRSAQRPSTTY